jgi:ketosteroid isomerase-like protein
VTIGRLHGRGKTSGADVDSPIGYVIDVKDGKALRYRDYFDPMEALEAAGLRE